MKMYLIKYRFRKIDYEQKLYAQNRKMARFKLATQHKTITNAIKVIECEEIQ